MAQANPGYLFYIKYFNPTPAALVNTDAIERLKNYVILSPIKRVICSNSNNIGGNTEPFKLVTTYPGLLIGSGYSHDVSKGMEGENALKIGFYFDHTTGMPVIPGSSIKGAVRGWFPSQYKKRAVDDSFRNPRYELIAHLINNITGLNLNHETTEERKKIDMFEKEMFEGVYENKPKTIYNRDIFFDAVPVEIQSNFKSSQGRLFYNDYLTPHKNRNNRHELDPFSDPNPIQFLKVMPNVVYEFKFDLRNSAVIPEMDAGKKRTLIQSIILFSGLGAKTNVGYGQFTDTIPGNNPNAITSTKAVKKFEKSDIPTPLPSLSVLKKHDKKTGDQGTVLFAEVVDMTPNLNTITVSLKVLENLHHTINNIDTSLFLKGDIVQVEFRGKSGSNYQFKLIN